MNFTGAGNHRRKFKSLFLFAFLILAFLIRICRASIPCVWTDVEKIVAVGDLHGDFKNFVTILKATSLVDDSLHWRGGKTQLVQMGDVMDRGPDARRIFDLIKTLEKEAEEAGGKVHMLIGNHEEMNITGVAFNYSDYMTVEQFLSFLPEDYRESKEKEFRERSSQENYSLRDFWQETLKYDSEARAEYLDVFRKNYGEWILGHNAIIKINDIIFVHGGLSEIYSTWKLENINDLLRRELMNFITATKEKILGAQPDFKLEMVYNAYGPLWYRELAEKKEDILKPKVDNILSNLGARAMVIAHTPQLNTSGRIISRFNGKIWNIDTGIGEAYGGHLSALIIEKGKFSAWHISHEEKWTNFLLKRELLKRKEQLNHVFAHSLGFFLGEGIPNHTGGQVGNLMD